MPAFPVQGGDLDIWGSKLRDFFDPYFDLATGALKPSVILSGNIAPGEINPVHLFPQSLTAPGNLQYTTTPSLAADGTVVVELRLTWTQPPEPNIDHYEWRIRETAGGNYVFGQAPHAEQRWSPLKPGVTYYVGVRAVDRLGNRSPYTADLAIAVASDGTAPSAPTGLAAIAAFRSVFLSWTNPANADFSHIEVLRAAANDRSTASVIGTVAGGPGQAATFVDENRPVGSTFYYWVRAFDTSLNPSTYDPAGATSGVAGTTVAIGGAQGSAELLDAVVVSAKLADGAVITGKLANLAVDTSKLADLAVSAAKLASGAVDLTKFATGLRPVQLVSSLPSLPDANYPADAVVVLSTDHKLYRNAAGTWTAAIPTGDLTGQITTTQITDGAISTPKLAANAVTAAKIAAGTVTANEIAADTILAGNIAAGAITASELAAASVVAGKLAANAIVAGDGVIANAAIGTALIADAAIQTAKIGDLQVLSGKIGDLAVTTAKLADLAVTTAKIATLAVDDAKIANLNASKITAGDVATARMQVNAANAVNAGSVVILPGLIQVSGGTTLADWRYGGDLTLIDGGDIAANTILANKAVIGLRGVTFTGCEVSAQTPTANTLYWTAGVVEYVNDAGTPTTASISGGNALWSSGTLYLYWAKGATTLSTTTSQATAFGTDNVVIASYRGTTDLVVNFGRTIIDGSDIVAGTITALGTVTTGILQNAAGTLKLDLINAKLTVNLSGGLEIQSADGVTILDGASLKLNAGGDIYLTDAGPGGNPSEVRWRNASDTSKYWTAYQIRDASGSPVFLDWRLLPVGQGSDTARAFLGAAANPIAEFRVRANSKTKFLSDSGSESTGDLVEIRHDAADSADGFSLSRLDLKILRAGGGILLTPRSGSPAGALYSEPGGVTTGTVSGLTHLYVKQSTSGTGQWKRLIAEGLVTEADLDWASAAGLSQWVLLETEVSFTFGGSPVWTTVTSRKVYLSDNENSIEYLAELRTSSAASSSGRVRLLVNAVTGTELTTTSTSYVWTSAGTVTVSGSGWVTVDIQLYGQNATTFLRNLSVRIK